MSVARQQFSTPLLPARLGGSRSLAAHVALGLLLAGALLLAGRRLAIAQPEPIALPTTLAAAVVLLAVVLAIRWAAAPRLAFWAPTVVLAAWAAACSFPGTQLLAWPLWIAALVADTLAARQIAWRTADSAARGTDATSGLRGQDSPADSDRVAEHLPPLAEGETVLQHVVRLRDPERREYVHATLRGDFEPGDRQTTLYLGFCPPFSTPPQVEAELIEGPPGIAKVVQSLHNGAQIEVELDHPSLDAVHVTVEVAAYEAAGE